MTDDIEGVNSDMQFRAPWSRSLKILTICFSLILLLVVVMGSWLVISISIAGFFLSLFFMTRGYSIEGKNLVIHRFLWNKVIDLAGLTQVQISPGVTSHSIRLFGIGGMFGYIGIFQNEVLGTYHAYLTDSTKAVVLTIDSKKFVISPDEPTRFSEKAEAAISTNK